MYDQPTNDNLLEEEEEGEEEWMGTGSLVYEGREVEELLEQLDSLFWEIETKKSSRTNKSLYTIVFETIYF